MVTKNIFFNLLVLVLFFFQSQYSFSSRLKVHKIPFEDILKELKILEKKLQLQYKSTYEKDFTPKPIDLYQKVILKDCHLTLKTYTNEGLIFRDFYDLLKARAFKKIKMLHKTYTIGFGRSSLMKRRMGLHFNTKKERDHFYPQFKKLSSFCRDKRVKSFFKQKRGRQNKEGEKTTFKGRIPVNNAETAGRVFDENQDVKIAHLSGEMSFLERHDSIKNAKKSILIQSLLFRGDEVGKLLGAKLIQRRQEGLDIRIMVDGLASQIFDNPIVKSHKKNTRILLHNLMAAGIRVYGFSCNFSPFKNEMRGVDLGKLTHRNHDKVWLVDSEIPEEESAVGIMGGINFAAEYFRLEAKQEFNWRDHDIAIKGKVLKEMRESFLRFFGEKSIRYRTSKYDKKCFNPFDPIKEPNQYHYFKNTKSKPYKEAALKDKILVNLSHIRIKKLIKDRVSIYDDPHDYKVPFPTYHDIQRSRYIHARPDEGEDYIIKSYYQLIESAKEEILIANSYFLPSPRLRSLLRNAMRRGVHVTILSNHVKAHKMNMINLVGRSYYYDLKKDFPDNIRILEWIGKKPSEKVPSHTTMHSKYMVIDGEVALLGSHNLDYSSLYNSETAVIFESESAALELKEYFTKMEQYSLEPSMDTLAYYKKPKGGELILFKILKLIEHRL